MKKLFGIIFLISILMIMMTGCGKKEVEPVAVDEKTDTCATCSMAVMDNQFATQIVLENGKSLLFDDIGCMYKWVGDNKDKKVEAQFVRDHDNKDWVLVDDATYVYNKMVKTPMAYNVVSFKDKKAAESFAEKNEGSTLLTASDLKSHEWVMNKEMMQQMKESMHTDHSHGDDKEMDHMNKEDEKK